GRERPPVVGRVPVPAPSQGVAHVPAACLCPAERAAVRVNNHHPITRRNRAMPVIKPRTRGKQIVRHIARLDRENTETLYAYAHFLGEPTEYVVNQLVESVLAKD